MATTKKKLTPAQKYSQLKRQTESAGMKVKDCLLYTSDAADE